MNTTPLYAFPTRALRRWRDERLSLNEEIDGSVSATFRFNGSTCGNVPFVLEFSARLALDGDGFRFLHLSCAPAPGDAGHRRMCGHLENAAALLAALGTTPPVVGAPLAAGLDWRPATTPAGCVCAATDRAHKWLAMLHTLHFALAARASLQPVFP